MTMQPVLDILTVVFMAAACFLSLTGAIGILRLPDFYTRLHPAGKNDSLAQALVMVALCFQAWRPEFDSIVGIVPRLVFIALFIYLTSPIATHAITKAAHERGLEIWTTATQETKTKEDQGSA